MWFWDSAIVWVVWPKISCVGKPFKESRLLFLSLSHGSSSQNFPSYP